MIKEETNWLIDFI